MDQLQIEILDQLSDDHFALWDFEASFPSLGPAGQYASLPALVSLVTGGFASLFLGDLIEMEGVRIDAQKTPALLRQPSTWQPSDKRRGYFLGLTAKGLEFLKSEGLGHP